MSTAYYEAPEDPETKKKKFWRDIIELNRDKVDQLMTNTNGTIRGGEKHHKLFSSSPFDQKSPKNETTKYEKWKNAGRRAFHRGKREVEEFRFHEIMTAGPYKMGTLRKVDRTELIWNPADLAQFEKAEKSLGHFLMTRKYQH